jgi:hypothetical protein
MDEDMSPIFLAMFLVTRRNGIVGGDWTVLGIMGCSGSWNLFVEIDSYAIAFLAVQAASWGNSMGLILDARGSSLFL